MSESKWSPTVELSGAETFICSRLKRTGRLFVFLRQCRHELFDEAFQDELLAMYCDTPRGTAAKPPALLAMVTLLQAYEQTSDAAAVENAILDRRWQMVLDNVDADGPIFSQGVLVDFRRRLVEHDMDRRLLERTVELAKKSGLFGHNALRVALDSAPLSGAGRVEDTFNLIGHAMDVVVECAATAAGLTAPQVRKQAGTKLLGHSSIKAALDIDWDDRDEKKYALERLLQDAFALRKWIALVLREEATASPLKEALDLLTQVIEQDTEPDPDHGGTRVHRGTAKSRRISISDRQMRHGRKSKSRTINGYKRHIAKDLDSGMILAAAVRPANERESAVEHEIRGDVERFGIVEELHIDRGYLACEWVKDLTDNGKTVLSKPWKSHSERFTKADFRFEIAAGTVACPAGNRAPIRPGKKGQSRSARFSAGTCRECPLRQQCQDEKTCGRTIQLHRTEGLLQRLRDQKQSSEGREQLRERVSVEHSLAHIVKRQGNRARYVGTRLNTLDMRRVSAVTNLQTLFRESA